MERYAEVKKIVKELLGDEKEVIDIVSLDIHENDDTELTSIECRYKFKHTGEHAKLVWSNGDGFVDALVNGFIEQLSEEYRSLENFYLSRYEVKARIKKKLIGEEKQTDASLQVEIGIQVPGGKEILFKTSDVSLVRATTKVVRDAIEFMINCEKAAQKARICLQRAQSSARVDLVSKYTHYLAELVNIASYEKVFN